MSEIRYILSCTTPLGPVTLATDGEVLTGLWFDGQRYDRAALKGKEIRELNQNEIGHFPVLLQAEKWLEEYFKGKEPASVPPLKVEGSEFRQLVAEIMLSIPYGQTMTYGEIGKIAAQRLGKKSMSAQAVGGAVGHNPISLIIPCHRVVGADGSLTGYAGGVEKKRYLLELESAGSFGNQ